MLLFIILNFIVIIDKSCSLLCYNGTFTSSRYGNDPVSYRGLFGPSRTAVARTRCMLTIQCDPCSENAMCFVRSWNARARHAWIVQRGCYLPTGDDTLPRSVNIPTRAMSCKQERHVEAEYKVCLCRADWCNSASSLVPSIAQYFYKWLTYIVGNIIIIF
ncbi:unnamed protein product [Spodoptera littoralis]|uniref:Protein quiver n=1 Tax=Spodoptera littoralis TaxID=7109 RepID=A0A9P0NBC4_SPOLI|nr:unnamed protein product [Spodoptera littoralis]CAH1646662.1 unnamed protein product [Spodoptera littoralis]